MPIDTKEELDDFMDVICQQKKATMLLEQAKNRADHIYSQADDETIRKRARWISDACAERLKQFKYLAN